MGLTKDKITKIVIDHDDNHILIQEKERLPPGTIVFANGTANPVGVLLHDVTTTRTIKDEPLYPPNRLSQ